MQALDILTGRGRQRSRPRRMQQRRFSTPSGGTNPSLDATSSITCQEIPFGAHGGRRTFEGVLVGPLGALLPAKPITAGRPDTHQARLRPQRELTHVSKRPTMFTTSKSLTGSLYSRTGWLDTVASSPFDTAGTSFAARTGPRRFWRARGAREAGIRENPGRGDERGELARDAPVRAVRCQRRQDADPIVVIRVDITSIPRGARGALRPSTRRRRSTPPTTSTADTESQIQRVRRDGRQGANGAGNSGALNENRRLGYPSRSTAKILRCSPHRQTLRVSSTPVRPRLPIPHRSRLVSRPTDLRGDEGVRDDTAPHQGPADDVGPEVGVRAGGELLAAQHPTGAARGKPVEAGSAAITTDGVGRRLQQEQRSRREAVAEKDQGTKPGSASPAFAAAGRYNRVESAFDSRGQGPGTVDVRINGLRDLPMEAARMRPSFPFFGLRNQV